MEALFLKVSPNAVIPARYILVCNREISKEKDMICRTLISRDNSDIAKSTALAVEILGIKLIYPDDATSAKYTKPNELLAMTGNMIILL